MRPAADLSLHHDALWPIPLLCSPPQREAAPSESHTAWPPGRTRRFAHQCLFDGPLPVPEPYTQVCPIFRLPGSVPVVVARHLLPASRTALVLQELSPLLRLGTQIQSRLLRLGTQIQSRSPQKGSWQNPNLLRGLRQNRLEQHCLL